jgi:hypothetical protein
MQVIRESAQTWESGYASRPATHRERHRVATVGIIQAIRGGRRRTVGFRDFLLDPPELFLKIRNYSVLQLLPLAIQFLELASQTCQLVLETVDPLLLLSFDGLAFLPRFRRLLLRQFAFLLCFRLLFAQRRQGSLGVRGSRAEIRRSRKSLFHSLLKGQHLLASTVLHRREFIRGALERLDICTDGRVASLGISACRLESYGQRVTFGLKKGEGLVQLLYLVLECH